MKSFLYSDIIHNKHKPFWHKPHEKFSDGFFPICFFFSHPEKLIIFHISHFDGGKKCISFEQLFVFLLQSYAEMSLVVLPFAYLQV